jgi:hypothetical protein
MAESRKLAAILVADVVGFSRLAGSDEERTLARLRALRSDLKNREINAVFTKHSCPATDGARRNRLRFVVGSGHARPPQGRAAMQQIADWSRKARHFSEVFIERVINQKTAIFRRVNQEYERANHDALELPNGEIVLLTFLQEGQQATVLQLPAAEKPPTSSAENKNAPISGQLVDFILT